MPEAEIQFANETEYDRLCQIRDTHGVTWRGMLLEGAKQVENHELQVALSHLTHVLVEYQDRQPTEFTVHSDSE